jgi:hypothetical protein
MQSHDLLNDIGVYLLHVGVHCTWSTSISQRYSLTDLSPCVLRTVNDSVLFDFVVSCIEIEDFENGVVTFA